MVMAPLPCFHGCPASLHRHLLPQSPPSHPLDPSLRSQTAALALGLLHNPQTPAPSLCTSKGPTSVSGVCMDVARTVWFSFHLGCHRSAVSLLDLNVSPLTQTIAPMWGSDPLPRAGPVLLTLLFFPLVPSFYQIFRGSIYSFPLIRYSSMRSAGIVHAVLCLMVYSWCIRGERCSPCPPAPSCSPYFWYNSV